MDEDLKRTIDWIMQNSWTAIFYIVAGVVLFFLAIFVVAFIYVVYIEPKMKKKGMEEQDKPEEPNSIRIEGETSSLFDLFPDDEDEEIDEENGQRIERETYRGPQETEYIEKLKSLHLPHYKLYKCTEAYRNESNRNRYIPYPAYFYVIHENLNTGNCAIVFESTFKGKASLIFIAKICNYENAIKAFGLFMSSLVIKKREILMNHPRYLYEKGVLYISRTNHDKRTWESAISVSAKYYSRSIK